MPQIEGGPKGLNSILESAYAGARAQGKDKGTASAIAWGAAKNSYKKTGGKWVEKLYRDLSDIAYILQNELHKVKDPRMVADRFDYLVFAVSKMAELTVAEDSISKIDVSSHLVWLRADQVEANPINRELDPEKVASIKEKIKSTGTVKPLVYTEVDNNGTVTNMITDGHHRLAALMEMGIKEFPARISDSRGVDTTAKDEPVELHKEIGSVDVEGLGLVRQDLQGKAKKKKPLEVAMKFLKSIGSRRSMRDADAEEERQLGVKKGGEGSGSWEGPGNPRFAWTNGSASINAFKAANEYTAKAGLAPVQPSEPVQADPERGRRIAEAYQNLKNDPNDPEVKRAYAALGNEVDAQFKTLPVKVEFTSEDPYHTSKEMMDDIEQNNRLKVFTGGEPHPLLGAKDKDGISLNDKFRAVHDYFGHAMFGHKFGPNGEENAWTEHSKMFSPEAQKAMTTETRGQNSWFNFSAENAGKAPHDRKFAEQKVGILPDEFLPKTAQSAAPAMKFEKADSMATCEKCGKKFDDSKLPEVGMGAVKCPGCGTVVNQMGKSWTDEARNASMEARRSHGNKAFEEPFHSGNHIKQFLTGNDVVIASVDKSHLSSEKNELRQKEFEDKLNNLKLPYKKASGVSSQWGNETSYIIHAPKKEDAESLHHMLTQKYKQDSVIHVRNGHAVLNFQGGTNEPTRHANVNNALESGDHLTDGYTASDGHKFRINFK